MEKQNKMIGAKANLGLALCITLLAGTTGTAAASQTSVEADFWNPSITNKSDVKSGNSSVNFKDDLGLNKKTVLDLKINFKNEENDPRTFFIQHDGKNFQSDKSLGKNIGFQGATYLTGDKVHSEVKYDHFQLGMKNESVVGSGKFSTIYQLNHVSLETKMNDGISSLSRDRKKTSNCLSIGFGWESIGTTQVFAEITPLTFGGGGYNDYNFGVKTHFGENTSFTVGYKGERLQTGKEKDGDRTRLDLKGVYWGLSSNF